MNKCSLLVSFFYFIVVCITVDAQYLVVILSLGLFQCQFSFM